MFFIKITAQKCFGYIKTSQSGPDAGSSWPRRGDIDVGVPPSPLPPSRSHPCHGLLGRCPRQTWGRGYGRVWCRELIDSLPPLSLALFFGVVSGEGGKEESLTDASIFPAPPPPPPPHSGAVHACGTAILSEEVGRGAGMRQQRPPYHPMAYS